MSPTVREARAGLVTITKQFTFEASHILPQHPDKCARLHGHSWRLVVSVRGPVDARSGFVCDFYELARVVDTHVIEKLDHTHLGYGPALTGADDASSGKLWHPYLGATFYPSSEQLVVAIARILQPLIPEIKDGISLETVELSETCTACARWDASDAVL